MARKKDDILAAFGSHDIPMVTEDDWKRAMLEVLIDIRDNVGLFAKAYDSVVNPK